MLLSPSVLPSIRKSLFIHKQQVFPLDCISCFQLQLRKMTSKLNLDRETQHLFIIMGRRYFKGFTVIENFQESFSH